MRERYLRAIVFAAFATIGLVVGSFVIGYGAALLSAPSPAPVVLPTLAATPWSAADTVTPISGIESTAQPTFTLEPASPLAQTIPSPVSIPSGEDVDRGLQLSLESLDVNSSLGGIEVVILLRNGTGREVNFSFWPEADLELADNLGRHYNLRWAEYDGIVTVPAGGSARLVRAFFDGVPGEDVKNLAIKVMHPPQLPENSWQVDLRD